MPLTSLSIKGILKTLFDYIVSLENSSLTTANNTAALETRVDASLTKLDTANANDVTSHNKLDSIDANAVTNNNKLDTINANLDIIKFNDRIESFLSNFGAVTPVLINSYVSSSAFTKVLDAGANNFYFGTIQYYQGDLEIRQASSKQSYKSITADHPKGLLENMLFQEAWLSNGIPNYMTFTGYLLTV